VTLSAFAPVLWRRCWTSSKPAARHCCGRSMGQTDRHRLLHPGTVLIYRSLGNLVVSREVPCLDRLSISSRKKQGHNEVGFPAPSSACGLYLEIDLQEWEPNSRVCGSRSSPPTLLSAVSSSFHRALYGYSQPPPRGGGINGLGLMSELVPNLP